MMIAGYTYSAAYWCEDCIDELVDQGVLVGCPNCKEWTIPDDPWAENTLRGQCVTDNHALAFASDQVEGEYPEHCTKCQVRLDTHAALEWIFGDEGIDAQLTPAYRLITWDVPLEDTEAFADGYEKHGLRYIAWVRDNRGRNVNVEDYEEHTAGMDPGEVLAAGERLRVLFDGEVLAAGER